MSRDVEGFDENSEDGKSAAPEIPALRFAITADNMNFFL
jgi:hypothetical protein